MELIRFIRYCSSKALDLLVKGVKENGYINYKKDIKIQPFWISRVVEPKTNAGGAISMSESIEDLPKD